MVYSNTVNVGVTLIPVVRNLVHRQRLEVDRKHESGLLHTCITIS